MPDELLPRVILVAIILLVGFPVHEFAHALAAYRLGDGTAKLFGRLTLNPIAHFDPLGGHRCWSLSVHRSAAFVFGWAKPTPVNPANLRGRPARRGARRRWPGRSRTCSWPPSAALPLRYILATPELQSQVPIIVDPDPVLFVCHQHRR